MIYKYTLFVLMSMTTLIIIFYVNWLLSQFLWPPAAWFRLMNKFVFDFLGKSCIIHCLTIKFDIYNFWKNVFTLPFLLAMSVFIYLVLFKCFAKSHQSRMESICSNWFWRVHIWRRMRLSHMARLRPFFSS